MAKWALANPHLSLHIPSDSRITKATARKRGGRPKRPRLNLTSILSNLHLLLRVPSFARWSLSVHFFVPEVYGSWQKLCSTATEPIRDTIQVLTDFGPQAENTSELDPSEELTEPWGIHALPLDYSPLKPYVAKTQSIFEFEREGACVVCGKDLRPGKGLYAVCSNTGCEGVGHVLCWSRHMLGEQNDDDILPISGKCPKCKGDVLWGDMMKEMSLRLRGPKDVEKLLKEPRKRKAKAKAKVDSEAEVEARTESEDE
ncbi:Slx4p interacting protein [Diatrype stigma]|uniref:Slx4p interacting protein n=1 Tax=Diatrype stigma TaxID=117547 RepID=A0AAN9YN60_9PEZI